MTTEESPIWKNVHSIMSVIIAAGVLWTVNTLHSIDKNFALVDLNLSNLRVVQAQATAQNTLRIDATDHRLLQMGDRMTEAERRLDVHQSDAHGPRLFPKAISPGPSSTRDLSQPRLAPSAHAE
jgi:hypothetical protein